jgi:hypothetical protein
VAAQVFRATYCESDVAVKKLNRVRDATSEEAFRHECAILKGCRNPYIVSFVGVCKDEVGPLPCAHCLLAAVESASSCT